MLGCRLQGGEVLCWGGSSCDGSDERTVADLPPARACWPLPGIMPCPDHPPPLHATSTNGRAGVPLPMRRRLGYCGMKQAMVVSTGWCVARKMSIA